MSRREGRNTTYTCRRTGFGDALSLRAIQIGRDFPLHRHDYYGFAIIDAGVEAYYARGQYHLVTDRDTVLLNADDVHTGAPYGESWSYRMLILEPETVAGLARDTRRQTGNPLFPDAVVQDRETRSKLVALMTTHERTPELLDEQLVDFYDHLIERHAGGICGPTMSMDAKALTEVRDLLIEEPFRSHSLSSLAAISGLSRTYLVTAFKQRYGLPPIAFQVQQRLAKARRLLLQSDLSIAAIAIDNGFYDQSDFSRHFSRTFGISPFRMRRQIQGKGLT